MLTAFVDWFLGMVVVSCGLGHVASGLFVSIANQNLGTQDEIAPWKDVPRWLRKSSMGIIERAFFTAVVASGDTGGGVAMVTWVGLKGAFYWNTFGDGYRAQVLVAVLGSLVSLTFAVLGAIVWTRSLPIP